MENDQRPNLIPRDEYSNVLRSKSNNPEVVIKTSVVDLIDDYGNNVTWNIKTIRTGGDCWVLIQKNDAEGGKRIVLPPDVSAAIARHREGAVKVIRQRGARKAAATREALGIKPSTAGLEAARKVRAAKRAGKR